MRLCIKRIFFVMGLAINSLLLQSCYYTTQGYYLFSYTYSAKNIKLLLEEQQQKSFLDQKTIDFLNEILKIQNFAHSINLKNKKKYNTYKEINKDYLVAVVQAAEELSVDPYKWTYPFMGKLPYKGYYNLEDAKKEAARLQTKGYDVFIRKVSAFSTLNILPDPIYSFMKDYKTYQFVEILLHEQVHATIWIKHNDAFNEQLATFIGREAMYKYMKDTFGENSKKYQDIFIDKHNNDAFRKIILETRDKLKNIYNNKKISHEQKIRAKQNILDIQQEYFKSNYDTLFLNEDYKKIKINELNNAYFALVSTYESNSEQFTKSFERCDKNIAKYITEVKKVTSNQQYKKFNKNPLQYLNLVCLN